MPVDSVGMEFETEQGYGPAHVGPRTGWITVPLPERLWDEPKSGRVNIEIQDQRRVRQHAASFRIGDLDPHQEYAWPISGRTLRTGRYRIVCRVTPESGHPHVYEGEFLVNVRGVPAH